MGSGFAPTSRSSTNTWTVPTVTSSTNLGALLTPLSLPADCLSSLWNLNTPGLITNGMYTYYTQGCAVSSCCPMGTPYSYSYEWLSTYYSPGVCPLSYRTCWRPPNLTPKVLGEFIAFCCPSNYMCPSDPTLIGSWWACHSLQGETPKTAWVLDNPKDQNTVGSEIVTRTGTYNVAYPLQIRWRSSDEAGFAAGSVRVPPMETQTRENSGGEHKTVGGNSNASLIGGLVAGIGVLGFLLLSVGALVLYRKRKGGQATPVHTGTAGVQELDGNLRERDMAQIPVAAELEDEWRRQPRAVTSIAMPGAGAGYGTGGQYP
ncbi:hypothetical protein K440DRAFT_662175 [Wilcoxina mikolae CBS 423.85]|nr:hypothetical protein K440DRAFT_662175 [Wilcoxina mikolae CBS 423.85]